MFIGTMGANQSGYFCGSVNLETMRLKSGDKSVHNSMVRVCI